MRIISGTYKGHILDGFDLKGTRPTMDRVKESLFGMIQGKVKNSICLDLFAGSGSLGLEAISNGAKCCYFVDHQPEAIQVLHRNVQNLKLKESALIEKQDYQNALKKFQLNNITFDIIFLDPPYQDCLIQNCLDFITQNHLLNKDGIIVCEYETEVFDSIYTCIKEKKYGTTWVRIYQFDNF